MSEAALNLSTEPSLASRKLFQYQKPKLKRFDGPHIIWFVLLFVSFFLGGVFGINLVPFGAYLSALGERDQTFLATILLLPSYWLVIFIHELGHILMAKGLGYKVNSLQAGPFILLFTPNGIKLGFNLSAPIFGGRAYFDYPFKQLEGFAKKHFLAVLAGPALTLFAGVIAFVVHHRLLGHHFDQNIFFISIESTRQLAQLSAAELYVHLVLTAIAFFAFILSLYFFVPFKGLEQGSFDSDSFVLLELLKGEQGIMRYKFLSLLQRQFYSHDLPRDWELAELEHLSKSLTRYHQLGYQQLHYAQASDREDQETMASTIADMLELAQGLPKTQWLMAHSYAMAYYAYHLKDREKARLHYDSVVAAEPRYEPMKLSSAYLAFVEEHYEEALDKFKALKVKSEAMPDSGIKVSSLRELDDLIAACAANMAGRKLAF
ncbi:MAG: site-2 protease family protein [Trueperaceae bacterium]|nr:site-2 protease family protein [Trueperaceae bacterium]